MMKNLLFYLLISIQLFNHLIGSQIENDDDRTIDHEFINRHELENKIENPKSFLIIIVIPLTAGIIVVSFLAILMFGSRIGTDKRYQITQAHELVQYYSVKNAFNNLRINLNKKRDI